MAMSLTRRHTGVLRGAVLGALAAMGVGGAALAAPSCESQLRLLRRPPLSPTGSRQARLLRDDQVDTGGLEHSPVYVLDAGVGDHGVDLFELADDVT